MNWALAQGVIGRGIKALSPPARAVGPNTYLREQDFFKMLLVAMLVHGLIFFIASLVPRAPVTNIPVRAISFKLGGQMPIAAFSPPAAAVQAAAPAPVMGSNQEWRANAAQPAPVTPAPLVPAKPTPRQTQPAPRPVKPQKIIPVPPEQRQMPLENMPAPLTPLPQATPEPAPQPLPAATQPLAQLPSTAPLTQAAPAIAATPQQYVREVGAANAGAQAALSAASMQEIRERYELQISGWIQRHKYYPADAAGREGRTVVRMRIDRSGYVRYYAIEQTSGVREIDAAAIDMIRRANPVPAVPENYPAGTLIEFLIPITFRAPR